MDARGLLRSVRLIDTAWRDRRAAAPRRQRRGRAGPLPRQAERARVPGLARGAQARPGGGVVWFERSALTVRVAVGGAVFFGWDGAGPEPSYALSGPAPDADARAELEPDKDGGWRVVSERLLVTVSRNGAVEICTPGGELLRREQPPRWWEAAPDGGGEALPDGGGRWAEHADGARGPRTEAVGAASAGGRWLLRSEVCADARFFGLGGRACGPRLRDGSYRLWSDNGRAAGPETCPLPVTMPLQFVVADAGTHLVFHDSTWDGRVTLVEGTEGRGSGHDLPGRCEVRMAGGPLRYWVLAGPPARVLHGWARLTGAPALPPGWALGYQHAGAGTGSEREVRGTVAGYRERGLPVSAVHLGDEHLEGGRPFTVDGERFPDLPHLAAALGADGVRLVSVVEPAARPEAGGAHGTVSAGASVQDERVRRGLGAARRAGRPPQPDFTDPGVRSRWGELYAERLAQGFAGVWHDAAEPCCRTAPDGPGPVPPPVRHSLEGRGGDHREAHNVHGLAMAQSAHSGLLRLSPSQRPFVLSRAGWAGMQRYGGAWSGGLAADWDGLRAALALTLGLGLSGVPYAGPDVAGGTAPPELFVRWFQLASCLPLFRGRFAGGSAPGRPWEYGDEVLRHCAAAVAGRERLRPYFATLAQLAHRTGAPYVRPLWWRHPRERALRDCDDAFLLGDALLVAPVLEPGVRRRTVRLPPGRWYDTTTGEAHEGPRAAELDAPLARVPVLARAGAAVPVTGADGGVQLDVWPPAPGRTGSGLLIADPGDGWQPQRPERFTVRQENGRTIVRRKDGTAAGYPVRVRT